MEGASELVIWTVWGKMISQDRRLDAAGLIAFVVEDITGSGPYTGL